jgi:hypothetical protein
MNYYGDSFHFKKGHRHYDGRSQGGCQRMVVADRASIASSAGRTSRGRSADSFTSTAHANRAARAPTPSRGPKTARTSTAPKCSRPSTAPVASAATSASCS